MLRRILSTPRQRLHHQYVTQCEPTMLKRRKNDVSPDTTTTTIDMTMTASYAVVTEVELLLLTVTCSGMSEVTLINNDEYREAAFAQAGTATIGSNPEYPVLASNNNSYILLTTSSYEGFSPTFTVAALNQAENVYVTQTQPTMSTQSSTATLYWTKPTNAIATSDTWTYLTGNMVLNTDTINNSFLSGYTLAIGSAPPHTIGADTTSFAIGPVDAYAAEQVTLTNTGPFPGDAAVLQMTLWPPAAAPTSISAEQQDGSASSCIVTVIYPVISFPSSVTAAKVSCTLSGGGATRGSTATYDPALPLFQFVFSNLTAGTTYTVLSQLEQTIPTGLFVDAGSTTTGTVLNGIPASITYSYTA